MATLDNVTRYIKSNSNFIDKRWPNSSPSICCRFDEKTMNKLKKYANAYNRSVAYVIRQIVNEGLNRYKYDL